MYRAGSILAFVLIVVASLHNAQSQPATLKQSTAPLGAQAAEDEVQVLNSAMRARIAVSTNRRTGRTIPASHCRHAVGGCDQRLTEFARYLVSAGKAHGIDPWLLAAMAFRESGFNPFAMGSLGELGILQIHPGRRDAKQVRFIRDEWYRKRCRRQPGACQQEIVEHAARVLSRSVELCSGDIEDALGAYNTGRCGGNRQYTQRVLDEVTELRRAAGLEAPEVPANRS